MKGEAFDILTAKLTFRYGVQRYGDRVQPLVSPRLGLPVYSEF